MNTNFLTQKNNFQEHRLKNLKGKQVLLIALPGYRDGIKKAMQDLGAKVDIINDKPNDGVVCKVLGRYKFPLYENIINRYYKKQLRLLKNNNYDFILVIRGEYTPEKTLEILKSYYPKSKLILYMWDSLGKLNTKGIEKKWDYFDRVYTFDRIDYENNKNKLSFLPLYYYEEYLPRDKKEPNCRNFKYDLSFIGTAHGDRIRIIKNMIQQCKNQNLHCFCYFYIPHPLVFLYNKCFIKDFKNVRVSDIRFRTMPFKRLYQIYNDSKCIIDIENINQHGLTMRNIEILGLKRKLITTNKDIVNYDFFNENNIFILDRNNPIIDISFLEKPYVMLNEDIYKKYSLKNWIIEVLK